MHETRGRAAFCRLADAARPRRDPISAERREGTRHATTWATRDFRLGNRVRWKYGILVGGHLHHNYMGHN